jgi:hypothetical protein
MVSDGMWVGKYFGFYDFLDEQTLSGYTPTVLHLRRVRFLAAKISELVRLELSA